MFSLAVARIHFNNSQYFTIDHMASNSNAIDGVYVNGAHHLNEVRNAMHCNASSFCTVILLPFYRYKLKLVGLDWARECFNFNRSSRY